MKKFLNFLLFILAAFLITIVIFDLTGWHHFMDEVTPFIIFKMTMFFILILSLLLEIVYFPKTDEKTMWIILLVIGILPFLTALFLGIYFAINGFSGLCLCGNFYGFKAFSESILLYLYNYYPNCLIGLILMILSIIKLKKTHKA